MIPVVSASRRDGLTSFHRLGRYLTLERSPETGMMVARGPAVISQSLLSAETAIVEMKATASMNVRVGDPILHFQISWREGERPDQGEWLKSATRSIEALGFSEHQYVVVAHDDTDNFHVHVMLNRVHPETYNAHNPRLSNLTLHRTARELEQQFGRKEDHGLYRWDATAGKPVRVEKENLIVTRQNAERPKGEQIALRGKMERFNDQESVRTFAADKPARALRQLFNSPTTSWSQVHALLGQHGLEIHAAEKGGYTVNVEGSQIKVKASDVFRFAFSGKVARAKTDLLLGPFKGLSQNSPLRPPRTDYDTHRPLSRNSYEQHIRQSHAPAPGKGAAPQSINNLRSVSSFDVVRAVEVDKMFLHNSARALVPIRRSEEHLRVRRGSAGESQMAGGARAGVAVASNGAAEERKAAWRRKMDEAAKERREARLQERQEERKELRAEFMAVREQHRSALHQHTLETQKRRAHVRAIFLTEKAHLRSGSEPWVVRKAYLSQRTAEYLIARQRLNQELAQGRAQIRRLSYQEWIEDKAEAGDKRAAAQLRGWRYQDRRNIRRIDTEATSAQTRAAGSVAGDPDNEPGRRKRDLDWEMLANDQLRQLRDNKTIPALSTMKWRADARSGDVTYTLSGTAALIDRGKQITVLQHDTMATRVALEMAIQKYGRLIEAKGSDVFQAQLIQAAARNNVDVVFTDPHLQARLVAARQQHNRQQEHKRQRSSEAEHGVYPLY